MSWKHAHAGLLRGSFSAAIVLLVLLVILFSLSASPFASIVLISLASPIFFLNIQGLSYHHTFYVPIYALLFLILCFVSFGWLSTRSRKSRLSLFAFFILEMLILNPLIFGSFMITGADAMKADDGLSLLASFVSIPATVLTFPIFGAIFDTFSSPKNQRKGWISLIIVVAIILALVMINVASQARSY